MDRECYICDQENPEVCFGVNYQCFFCMKCVLYFGDDFHEIKDFIVNCKQDEYECKKSNIEKCMLSIRKKLKLQTKR